MKEIIKVVLEDYISGDGAAIAALDVAAALDIYLRRRDQMWRLSSAAEKTFDSFKPLNNLELSLVIQDNGLSYSVEYFRQPVCEGLMSYPFSDAEFIATLSRKIGKWYADEIYAGMNKGYEG